MKTTKEKILEAGAQIVRRKGFNNTGLVEILKETGVPKGSFYFYFPSKEQFGLELIDVYTSFMENEMVKIMSDKSESGLKRLKNFLNFTKNMFSQEDYIGGCPLGNLALEMGDVNDNFRKKISEGFKRMESIIYNCLQDAQKSGEISEKVDVKKVSQFILNSWEGALVRMKVEKSIESLNLLEYYIFNNIINCS
jgi:TetR/AcrR family transcriptional repressor of nem operon